MAAMRSGLGATAADTDFLVDTRAAGHLLSAPQGLNHFLASARAARAEVIVLDPLYSAHDRDENDTQAMAGLCQSLLRLREASKAALIVVHHVRKSAAREEVGSAFRGSSALHAVGDSYLLARACGQTAGAVELRFQFRYAAAPPPRRLRLDPDTLWFAESGVAAPEPAPRRKVEGEDVRQALTALGGTARFNPLRDQLMARTQSSNRTAQLAVADACQRGLIARQPDGTYFLPAQAG